MTDLVLDGAKMRSLDDLHEQVARHPETPEIFGRNLDALSDVVSGFYSPPNRVIWFNADLARQALGNDFDRVLKIFEESPDTSVELIQKPLPRPRENA